MGRYRDVILRQADRKKEKQDKEQEKLHERYHILDPDAVVVEKNRALGVILFLLQIMADMVLLVLAFFGVASLVCPDTRQILWSMVWQILSELSGCL